jgi:hypothetical protein
MPLPTNGESTAGTTTTIQNAPGSAGYTGSYTFIDPGGTYPQSKLDAQVTGTVNGFRGGPGGGGKSKKGFGINLPDFSGLDRALGVLGSALAIGQLISSTPALLSQAGQSLKAFGRDAASIFRNIKGQLSGTPAKKSEADPFQVFTKVAGSAATDWRVKISTNLEALAGDNNLRGHPFEHLKETGGMVFPFTPSITMTHKANYTVTDPTHNNFSYQGYKNSSVEDITITCDFPVNTYADGQYWIAATTFLKSATKMFYGQSTPQGNPPIVCYLSGYGPYIFNGIPVVIKSYQVELKDNVSYKRINSAGLPDAEAETGLETTTMSPSGKMVTTYIREQAGFPSAYQTWVPMMSTITVIVSPIYNRERVRQFTMRDYTRGMHSGVL